MHKSGENSMSAPTIKLLFDDTNVQFNENV